MLDKQISSEFGLHVRLAGEIEFYLITPVSDEDADAFLEQLEANITKAGLRYWNIQREVSPDQFEVALQPAYPENALSELKKLKRIISDTALKMDNEATFDAKPFDNLPGSGLHIHIGVNDTEGNSALGRPGDFGNRNEESPVMLAIIGGLCETMLKNFITFAPTEASYKRFASPKNKLDDDKTNPLAAYNNVPVNVSWGGNNRTTALRIPMSTYDETNRHIEHRVAGADADPTEVMHAILEGIYFGLKNNPTPPKKIHGNAFDEQYSFLVPFPKTLAEAKKLT